MKGEAVIVERRVKTGVDGLNNPIYEVASMVEVANVLVCPGSTSDVIGSMRPDGAEVTYTLHFPKTFSGSLRGCRISVRGEWFSVIGDPQPYTTENTPGLYNRPVEVEAVYG